jgi:amino acid transporter
VQSIGDLPYRSRFQPYLSYIFGTAFFIIVILNSFKVFVSDSWDTSTFLTSYIGIPIFLALYFGHKFTRGRSDPWMIPSEQVDLQSGLAEIIAAETPAKPSGKWH